MRVIEIVVGVGRTILAEETSSSPANRGEDGPAGVEDPGFGLALEPKSGLEDWGLITGTLHGPYPWFGSVYPGGGFAAGAGVRNPIGDDGAVTVFGGYSIASFSRIQADVALPSFALERLRLTLSAGYLDAPDVRYFGIGNFSRDEDETHFGYTPKGAGIRLDVRGGRHLSFAGGVRYLDIATSAGRTGTSIAEGFSPANTPGLERVDFTYVNSMAGAAFDWRKPLAYSGGGGLYRIQLDDYRDRDGGLYSFRSIEAEVVQLFPILRANWVIALRGLATLTDIADTAAVPYFLLPSLGGGSTLRGYPDFRFRDRHRMLMNAELRWTPARFKDMAIFYDTGKVASIPQDLNFQHLNDSDGIGMRIVGMAGYAFRIEVAHRREHAARLIIGVGGTF